MGRQPRGAGRARPRVRGRHRHPSGQARLSRGELSAGERVTVVSPHLDDAVLSLGATIANIARRGVRVTILTVFACDPDSTARTKGWDARAGFATEGAAARARRLEDAAACAVVGAAPRWLAFGSIDYARHGAPADISAAVGDALEDASLVLLPATPLSHPDHALLVETVAGPELGLRRLGLYAEQPYLARAGGLSGGEVPRWLCNLLGCRPRLERNSTRPRDWLAKRRAIRCYRSQLPLLALANAGIAPLERHLLSEVRSSGERAWIPAEAASGRS